VDIVALCSVTEYDVKAGYMQVSTHRTWILLLCAVSRSMMCKLGICRSLRIGRGYCCFVQCHGV
jgi:hypothetical protein